MKISNIFLAGLFLSFLSSCAPKPAPPPDTSESAAIGISIMYKGLFGESVNSDSVWFVRLEDGESIDSGRVLLRSNLKRGSNLYLINVRPGRYAVVRALRISNTPEAIFYNYNYIPHETIEKSLVEVRPGSIAYAGTYILGGTNKMKGIDEAQKHYIFLTTGKPPTESKQLKKALSSVMGGMVQGLLGSREKTKITYIGLALPREAKRTKESEREFLNEAKEELIDPGWIKMIDRRLQELK